MSRVDLDLDRELERLRAATDAIAPEDGLTDAILGAVKSSAAARDPLADLAKATADIEAPEALTDAVVARATSGQRPPMAAARATTESASRGSGRAREGDRGGAEVIAIDPARRSPRRPASWTDGVMRSGPIAVGLAIVAAAASFLFFVTSQGEADATVVSSVDTVEVIE